jgi:hypothetical protein
MKRLSLLLLLLCLGCTSAERGKVLSYGSPHKVELYSGGEKVREWTSTGKVHNETNSDGFYFTDKDTGAHVRVTGDVVVTRD